LVVYRQKFALALILYIYSLSHDSQSIESFASILSRSQKIIVHTFFWRWEKHKKGGWIVLVFSSF